MICPLCAAEMELGSQAFSGEMSPGKPYPELFFWWCLGRCGYWIPCDLQGLISSAPPPVGPICQISSKPCEYRGTGMGCLLQPEQPCPITGLDATGKDHRA